MDRAKLLNPKRVVQFLFPKCVDISMQTWIRLVCTTISLVTICQSSHLYPYTNILIRHSHSCQSMFIQLFYFLLVFLFLVSQSFCFLPVSQSSCFSSVFFFSCQSTSFMSVSLFFLSSQSDILLLVNQSICGPLFLLVSLCVSWMLFQTLFSKSLNLWVSYTVLLSVNILCRSIFLSSCQQVKHCYKWFFLASPSIIQLIVSQFCSFFQTKNIKQTVSQPH